MWPKETEIRRILQELMGRITEKAGEVGAVPGLPEESHCEVI